MIFAIPVAAETSKLGERGLKVKRRATPYTIRGFHPKTSNYLESIVALDEAGSEGFDDILWSNADHELTELSTANVFFLGRDGDRLEVATPALMSGILPGITRATMIDLLHRASIPVTERIIYVDEIARFDEAFAVSTVRGLMPIGAIDSHRLHSNRPQAIFRQFERLYLSWVESVLGFRVDWSTGAKVSPRSRE
jgi:branched-subunit amino acid aminotransferase/4-amino-4-deoxychorismate lyase